MPHVSVRMDEELHKRLCQQAETEDRSLSWIVTRALRTELDRMTSGSKNGPQTGKPWSDPTSDPLGDVKTVAEAGGAPHSHHWPSSVSSTPCAGCGKTRAEVKR